MMLAEIFLSCLGRPADAIPFYIYIDECHRFLTEDVAKLFTEGRKFKTHAVSIHQVLAQLREAGDFVFNAVMAARTKILFGGNTVVNQVSKRRMEGTPDRWIQAGLLIRI